VTTLAVAVFGAVAGFGAWLLVASVAGWPVLSPAVVDRARHRDVRFQVPPARGLAAVAGGVTVGLVTGWPVAALAVAAGVVLFWGRYGSKAMSRDITARSEAVATWAEMLRDTIVAGAGLPQALVTAARVGPTAIAPELARLAERIDGYGVQVALERFAVEVAHPAVDVLVVALVMADRHGTADLVSLMTAQAEATRHEVDLVLETEAGRARYRIGARIMLGALALFALGLLVFRGEFLAPYDTWTGQLVLAVISAVILLALWLLVSMGRLRPPARYFAPTEPMAR
jgi:tight adherence protein B